MTTKTKAEHTKGPWSHPICDVAAGIFAELDGQEIQLCRTINGRSEEEREANARLIAAAPELLEALDKAEKVIRDLGDRLHTYGTPVSFVFANECRDLVRKARGE
jgi:hypothetical protein